MNIGSYTYEPNFMSSKALTGHKNIHYAHRNHRSK